MYAQINGHYILEFLKAYRLCRHSKFDENMLLDASRHTHLWAGEV